MSAWRNDLLRVNGFDERFEGYGGEDQELAYIATMARRMERDPSSRDARRRRPRRSRFCWTGRGCPTTRLS